VLAWRTFCGGYLSSTFRRSDLQFEALPQVRSRNLDPVATVYSCLKFFSCNTYGPRQVLPTKDQKIYS
jgi:hypothetical protein